MSIDVAVELFNNLVVHLFLLFLCLGFQINRDILLGKDDLMINIVPKYEFQHRGDEP